MSLTEKDQAAVLQFLDTMADELRTQDGMATAHPMYAVQEKVVVYRVAPDEGDGWEWHSPQDPERTPGQAEAVELYRKMRAGEPTPGCERVGYRITWQVVTVCLTREGALDYLRNNGHNLTEPRVYVLSGWRNREVQMLRHYFLELYQQHRTAAADAWHAALDEVEGLDLPLAGAAAVDMMRGRYPRPEPGS